MSKELWRQILTRVLNGELMRNHHFAIGEGGYGAGRPHNIVHAEVGGIIIGNDEIVDCNG
jgi:hypothetical protein